MAEDGRTYDFAEGNELVRNAARDLDGEVGGTGLSDADADAAAGAGAAAVADADTVAGAGAAAGGGDVSAGTRTTAPIARITIAPGVIETIIAEAAKEVDGVAGVGKNKVGRTFSSVLEQDDDLGARIVAEDGKLVVDVDIQVYYGYRLQDLITDVKASICDSLKRQAGIDVESVNVYVSSLHTLDRR